MKSKAISKCALVCALSFVVIYISNIIDTLNIAMLGVATCLMCIVVDTEGVKPALATYAATSIVLYLLLPDKFMAIAYFIAFGNYAIVKFYIEKIRNLTFEIIIKLVVGNIYILLCYFFAQSVININTEKIPLWGLYLAANVIFLVCDYAISVLYSYLYARFSRLSFWRK